MPKSASEKVYRGVVKDPLDLRDLYYESGLFELPFAIDNRPYVPVILDQEQEGSCTGFGLAAVVNFLHYNRSDLESETQDDYEERENGASPRMLYEMAKRYDEWEGENYEGSSLRGAMKGWMRHGVCTWGEWPYEVEDAGRMTPARQRGARAHPLGAYYRVRHRHLNQMQAALYEAGILYASASVHEGWHEVDEDGYVPFRKTLIGGHAFAIVGYDDQGFWVQNSWGPDWGVHGFCHLSYADWLENGYDCWVARLGVPVSDRSAVGNAIQGRAGEFKYAPDKAVISETIRPHMVNLGNDGRFSSRGMYTSDEAEVDDVVLAGFRECAGEWSGPARLLLYCHGGLNDEKASASRIFSMRPFFLANRIYPVHFMWETGFLDSVRGIVEDAFRRGRFQGWTDRLKEKFFDLLDEGVELAARPFGRPIWSQMKDNAARASVDAEGGARYTAGRIAACLAGMQGKTELHLVGHSAGSIFIAHLLPILSELEVPVESLTLFAPACTVELFDEKVTRRLGRGVNRFAMFNLSDGKERDDSVGPAYHKSLLYLVSEAFEQRHREPLLGMEAFLAASGKLRDRLRDEDRRRIRRVSRALGKRHPCGGKTVIRALNVPDGIQLESKSISHGGFDNDKATLNSTLRFILGKKRLAKPF